MTDEEKRKFLKKMGYNPRMLDPEPHLTKKAEAAKREWKPANEEDARLLLKLNKAFNKGEDKCQHQTQE